MLNALRNIFVNTAGPNGIGTRMATVMTECAERWTGFRFFIGKPPHLSECAIDNLHAHLGVQQDNTDRNQVERGPQHNQFVGWELLGRDIAL